MRHLVLPRRFLPAALLAVAVLGVVSPEGLAAAPQGQSQLKFGVEMAKRGLWSEALFRFERAYRENPGSSRILNNLAVAHEAVGNFDKALELYRQAVKIDPGNADLKRNYARFVEFYQSFRPVEEDEEEKGEEGEVPQAESAAQSGGSPEVEPEKPEEEGGGAR